MEMRPVPCGRTLLPSASPADTFHAFLISPIDNYGLDEIGVKEYPWC